LFRGFTVGHENAGALLNIRLQLMELSIQQLPTAFANDLPAIIKAKFSFPATGRAVRPKISNPRQITPSSWRRGGNDHRSVF
jgi:hypothetical protein